jgi:hypothetical protein
MSSRVIAFFMVFCWEDFMIWVFIVGFGFLFIPGSSVWRGG